MTSTKNPPGKRLFVGGIPYKFREGQLLSLFVDCGKVIDVRIIKDRLGKSRGLAYVEFENEQDAIQAKEKYHNYKIAPDRTIIVDFARPDPFLTPEGKARHQKALQIRQMVENRKPHIRQSLHNSRNYGSRIGAKFARRTQNRQGHRS